jgi:uncharacterized protein (DUF2235 family)
MNTDFLKMNYFVNGLSVGLWEKSFLKMQGDRIDLEFSGGKEKKKLTLEGKAAAGLKERIRKTSLPLISSDVPDDRFDGVIFDVTVENRNGKMHFRWVNKAKGMEDLQVLIAEIMKLNAPEKPSGSGKK